MSNEALTIILQQFKDAQKQFVDALSLSSEKNDVIRDGTIQRFEFTFEICWKALKRFLENEGLQPKTPKETFQEAFRLGWLSEGDDLWSKMIKDRNLTSHTYSKPLAKAVYERLPSYQRAYERLLQTLSEKLK